MSPDDKAKLVEQLQINVKTEVGMCGDGANDCGALKQADIGISLSEAEASIAAPFTSQIQDISSVVIVLKEGRCALTTSFQMFKFIELYALIQFVSCTLLYYIGCNLGDYQFLYQDLILIVPLSTFMGYTGPYKVLTQHVPANSLFSPPVLASVIGSAVIQLIFQAFSFFYVRKWSFYQHHVVVPTRNVDSPLNNISYEGTVLFYVTLYQYLTTCVAFSISKPFRQPIYTNLYFTLTLIVLLGINIFMTLDNADWLLDLMNLEKDTTLDFRLSILLIAFVNGVATFIFEKIGIWHFALWFRDRKEKQRKVDYAHEMVEIQEA